MRLSTELQIAINAAVREAQVRRHEYVTLEHLLFALIHDERRKPSLGGTLVYLDAAGKLDGCVERVRSAGGTLLMPKTPIGEYGFIAVLGDTEGNSVALHSPRAG